MYMQKLAGVVPPIVVPLNGDGTLDEAGFQRQIDHLTAGGVQALFTMGTFGEGSVLPRSTWLQVHKKALAYAQIPVICGAIESSTLRTIEALKQLEDIGAATAVVTTPFFYRAQSEGELVRHFEAICAATSLNVITYNIPVNSGTNIPPAVIRRLVDIPNYAGLKDSSGDVGQMLELIDICRGTGATVLGGDVPTMGTAMLLGADGCVPGPGNYFPQLFVRLWQAAQKREVDEVVRLQLEAIRLSKVGALAPNWVASYKYIGRLMDLHEAHLAAPGQPPAAEVQAEIKRLIEGGFGG